MKTTFDACDIAFDLLNVPELTDHISGKVYHQNSRPADSRQEDVVVTGLSITDGHIQQVVVNVNIYVSDIKIAGTDVMYPAPNRSRLKAITAIATDILKGNSGRFWKDGELKISLISGPFPHSEIKQHYVNIRIDMRLHGNYN